LETGKRHHFVSVSVSVGDSIVWGVGIVQAGIVRHSSRSRGGNVQVPLVVGVVVVGV
jgi:hypothetical protein